MYFLGVLWYQERSPFYYQRKISVLQYIHSYVILKMFLLQEFDKYFYDTFLSLEASFSCVFFKDKVFKCERLIYVKNTKKINVYTYFYFKKALFT